MPTIEWQTTEDEGGVNGTYHLNEAPWCLMLGVRDATLSWHETYEEAQAAALERATTTETKLRYFTISYHVATGRIVKMSHTLNFGGTKVRTISPDELGLFVTYTLQLALSKVDIPPAERKGMLKLVGKSLGILRTPTLLALAPLMLGYEANKHYGEWKEFAALKEDILSRLETK